MFGLWSWAFLWDSGYDYLNITVATFLVALPVILACMLMILIVFHPDAKEDYGSKRPQTPRWGRSYGYTCYRYNAQYRHLALKCGPIVRVTNVLSLR